MVFYTNKHAGLLSVFFFPSSLSRACGLSLTVRGLIPATKEEQLANLVAMGTHFEFNIFLTNCFLSAEFLNE